MNGYFYTLLLMSVCGAVCTLVAGGGFEKYIKYIASLACVCLMLLPLRGAFSELGTVTLPEESTQAAGAGLYELSSQITTDNAEKYICEIVFGEFGIIVLYADINIDWSSETPTINGITVALRGDDYAKRGAVAEYLQKTLGGEVNVIEG